MKYKRSEEYEVLEEVFDKPTLLTLYDLINKGYIDEFYGVVKAGKESRIYWAKDPQGRDLAVKIYLITAAEFRKSILRYIEGDRRFSELKRRRRKLIYAWAMKEFKNLKRAKAAGVRVPDPVAVKNNVLVMEFIGEEGMPAPLLKDVELDDPQAFYEKLLDYVRRLYQKARLVHGDLSEYNVMVWKGEPVLFDLSQALPIDHPAADELLKRDIENINRYFAKLGVEVREDAYEWVVSKT